MEKARLLNYIAAINPEDRQKTERILNKVISKYLSDPKKSYIKRYELEFFNSKDIEKLLTLLENSMSNIRKLALLVIGLVLMNPLSKIFFLEKCGLSLVIGRFFLTRLKYIYNFSQDQRNATKNVLRVMKLLKISGTGPKGTMFWYISLDLKKNRMAENFHPKLHEFRVHDMLDQEGNIDLSLVPDPVYNLCGLEFFDTDKQTKIEYQLKLQHQSNLDASEIKQTRAYAQSTITASKHNKIGRQSYGGVNKLLGRSGVYKGRPLTGTRLKVMRGSAKADVEGYQSGNQKNPSLYFRSTINQPSSHVKTGGSKFDSLNNISGNISKTLKMGIGKQMLGKMNSNSKRNSGMMLAKTPRTLGKKIKLQNSLITNSKRNKVKLQKTRLSTNMSPFQFGTNSTTLQDRRNTFNFSGGGGEPGRTGLSDFRSKFGVKGSFGVKSNRNRGNKFGAPNGRFVKGFKTGNHN
jgi:hypothetical protein